MSNSDSNRIQANERISSVQFLSEFVEKGYDRPDFVELLSNAFSRKTDGIENSYNLLSFWERLLEESERRRKTGFVSKVNNLLEDARFFQEAEIAPGKQYELIVPEMDFDTNAKECETKTEEIYSTFELARKQLYNQVISKGWDLKTLYPTSCGYMQAYYAILQKVIFSPANYHLNDLAFRRSGYLQNLVQFSTRQIIESNRYKAEEGGRKEKIYRFSYLDPFAMDIFLRSIEGAKLLDKSLPAPEKRSLLDKLRIDLFLTSVQSAFSRYTYLDNQPYRVQLNRHTSQLLAIPYDQISSVEEIKPIRLFEKITGYIRKQAYLAASSESEKLQVKVCILGHTECTRAGDEACMEDLVGLILKWYCRLETGPKKPTLDFTLNNYVNKQDYSAERHGKNSVVGEPKNNTESGDRATYCIEAVDYSSQFSFTTATLRKYIFKHDLIFILDCPWMTAENYEMKLDGSLRAFTKVLSDISYSPDFKKSQFFSQFQYFFKGAVMRRIDGQMGRILGSDTGTAGQVIRILKEPVLNKIGLYLKKKALEKGCRETIVYLFTSEKDGVNLASIASDPLTRTEKYDGKTFTIVKYSSQETTPLELEEEEGSACFRIHLWSIIKYISVSFAYLDLKESLLELLCSDPELLREEVDVLGIYQSIYVLCELDNRLRTVTCRLRLSKEFEACLPKQKASRFEEIKREVLAWARTLIEPLYCKVVFANVDERKTSYGDDAIRTAFRMNLYSSAEDVQTMLFWHRYRMLERDGLCGMIKCVFPHEINTELWKKTNAKRDFFNDKKLYDSVLYNLERSSNFSIAMDRMFVKADQLFKTEPTDENIQTGRRILKNIIDVCERHEWEDSPVYLNARKAILEYL